MDDASENDDVAPWTPRSREDQLLGSYLDTRGGSLFVEVPIGGRGALEEWPAGSTQRRIDGVFIGFSAGPVARFNSATETTFRRLLPTAFVELVEVKTALDRTAIGQAVAARRMFRRHYGFPASRVVILCSRVDTALAWVCKEELITVIAQPKPPSLASTILLGQLFEQEPLQWGLRGDPWLWREMKEALRMSPLPADADSVRTVLLQTYEMLVGTTIAHLEPVDVPRYRHVGISGGQVSPRFWTEVGMPTLLRRAQELT